MTSLHPDWSSYALSSLVSEITRCTAGDFPPTPLQHLTLQKHFLDRNDNTIVVAPTNSGKTLLAYWALLTSVQKGHRVILLEPLRALAQEKYEELKHLVKQLKPLLGTVRVAISTGDYRLEHEFMSSDQPPAGQLIVATPERLEALMRAPSAEEPDAETPGTAEETPKKKRKKRTTEWLDHVHTVVIDEAHLLSDATRGLTLEMVMSGLMDLLHRPRIILLSGTVGSTAALEQWKPFQPCLVVRSDERTSPLHWEVQSSSDKKKDALTWAKQVQEENGQGIIFVYQTTSCAVQAREINVHLGEGTAFPFHSKMSTAEKAQVRQKFLSGEARFVVSTTALAMGLNLPCTHVLVRDTTRMGGEQDLEAHEIMQMLGRAGRGSTPGKGTVLLESHSSWTTSHLTEALTSKAFPDLKSSLSPSTTLTDLQKMLCVILMRSRAMRGETISIDALKPTLETLLGARHLVQQLPEVLYALVHSKMVFCTDQKVGLTRLGVVTMRSVLPLEVGSGAGALIRALMGQDPTDELLHLWTPMDSLLLICLTYPGNTRPDRRFGEVLVEQIENWVMRNPIHKPMLYRFIAGTEEGSKAEILLNTLGVHLPGKTLKARKKEARKIANLALLKAILLFERANPRVNLEENPDVKKQPPRTLTLEDLERFWSVKNLSGIDERMRDETLWLLSGLNALFEVRTFYFHLREACQMALPEGKKPHPRLDALESTFKRIRKQNQAVMEGLKYARPLGQLLKDLQDSTGKHIFGEKTLRKLEAGGVTGIAALKALSKEDLKHFGLRSGQIQQLMDHLQKYG